MMNNVDTKMNANERMTAQKEVELIRLAQGDYGFQSELAKEELYNANRGFINFCAKEYVNVPLNSDLSVLPYEAQEAILAGTLGFYEAVKKFDPSKGFRLSTFAKQYISYEIASNRAKMRRGVSIPEKVERRVRKYFAVEANLTASLGERPSHDEIVSAMGITKEEGDDILNILNISNYSSLKCTIDDEESSGVSCETIESSGYLDLVDEVNTSCTVYDLKKVLTPIESAVLDFFNSCVGDVTNKMISEVFGISEFEARKIRLSIRSKASDELAA